MTVIETMSASNELGSSGLNPVMVKTSQEILTSLHLIKDIRRLEKYQRDFFLKVTANREKKVLLVAMAAQLGPKLVDKGWTLNKKQTNHICTERGLMTSQFKLKIGQ